MQANRQINNTLTRPLSNSRPHGATSISAAGRIVPELLDESGRPIRISLKSTTSDNYVSVLFDDSATRFLAQDNKGGLTQVNLSNLSHGKATSHRVLAYAWQNEKCDEILAVLPDPVRLVSISTVSKKVEHITNLNIGNKIVSLKVNVVRDLVLIVDSSYAIVYDLKARRQFKSLKAQKQKFADALFLPDNKTFALINQNLKIRLIDVYTMQQVSEIKLGDAWFSGPRLQTSLKHKYLTISGNFYGLYVYSFIDNNLVNVRLPFKVSRCKFLSDGSIVVLGRNQVYYLLNLDELTLIELFNSDSTKVMYNFDVPPNGSRIVGAATNQTFFIYNMQEAYYQKIMKVQFEEVKAPQIKVKENLAESRLNDPFGHIPDFEIKEPKSNRDSEGALSDQEQDNPIQDNFDITEEACNAYRILRREFGKRGSGVLRQYSLAALQTISAFQKLYEPKRALSLAYFYVGLANQENTNFLRQIALMFIPKPLALITKRFKIDFQTFSLRALTALFLDFFNMRDWQKIVVFIGQKGLYHIHILSLFWTVYLKTLEKRIEECENEAQFLDMLGQEKPWLNLDSVLNECSKILADTRYNSLFSAEREKKILSAEDRRFFQKQTVNEYASEQYLASQGRLTSLLQANEALKQTLAQLQIQKHSIIDTTD